MRERRKEKDAARKNPSVKKNTLREPQKMKKSRVRGFIIATVLFVFLLLVVYLVQSSQPTVLRVSDNDMMQLTAAIDNVEKEVSISSLMELTGAMAPLSVFMEDALLKNQQEKRRE
ncbi:hypothetical protein AGDE_13502 [Angomonas deanei]|uniref:Uncharacterized protein n=1 Tax=Angomonas deanei TaxID=59799 RepID=A0A7G2C065_9TRYP|nr:hypothetical protein AGDE_13502 [Angomonas deanei]CAD2213110.1 hypothetical protein, conserved [Angomonas deanei]|eukprot:EPY22232.1 hypothetical protein AGDE_13502 [Angomonas deanei]